MEPALNPAAECTPDPAKCGVRLWHLVRENWVVLSAIGMVLLLALSVVAENRFIPRAVYERDQAATVEQLREIRSDVKELLKRR